MYDGQEEVLFIKVINYYISSVREVGFLQTWA